MGCSVSTNSENLVPVFQQLPQCRVIKPCIGIGREDESKDNSLLKSPNDKNLYKAFTLPNGLKVLLIHTFVSEDGSANTDGTDDNANVEEPSQEIKKDNSSKSGKMAAAALSVNVGSLQDPVELQGLAHFLEHMVFMGSEKYPEENYYTSYISKHGGSYNAYTSREHTVYHMDVEPTSFKEALDIMANCFISPLLKPDSMDREVEAVDSEFKLSSSNDDRRTYYVFNSLAKPGHPISKFQCGNHISLKVQPENINVDVNAALHKFYQEHYSASNMALAVQSTDTLDTLEEWVKELFSDLPNSGLYTTVYENFEDAFERKVFNKIYKVVPVTTTDEMSITWALPPVQKHYKSKPLRYLACIIGHGGKGSLLAYLKKKCWVTILHAGESESTSIGVFFSISIILTEQGMDHQYDVITAVFQYLKMLLSNGPQERLFNEFDVVARAAFRFQEQEDPVDNVTALAENMQLFPVEHYIAGTSLFFEFDPKIISHCLEVMQPWLANIIVISSRYTKEDCKDVEKWTNCKFSSYEIPNEFQNNWKNSDENPEFHLPEPNDFITTDFELKHEGEAENKYPVKIFEDEIGCVWFKEDVKFKTPKAYITYRIITPVPTETASRSIMNALFILILAFKLREELYSAGMAELDFDFNYDYEGFVLTVSGFNEKLNLLLEKLVEVVVKFDPDEDTFQNMKDFLLKKCNSALIYPENLAGQVGTSTMLNKYFMITEEIEALKLVTNDMLKTFVQQCFETSFLEGLFQGNITKEEALSIDKTIREKMNLLPLLEEQRPEFRVTQLPASTTVCRVVCPGKEDENSVIANYYQYGPVNIKSSCLITLLSHFMMEPCFDVLRTQEQLGYHVSCSCESLFGIYGLKIFVKSPSSKFSCIHIDNRIEEFLKNCLNDLQEMDETKFETQRNSVVHNIKCEDLNLAEEVSRFWSEIMSHNYIFDRKELQVEFLENLSFEEFKEWLSEYVQLLANEKRKFSVQVLGPSDEIVLKLNETAEEESNENEDVPESDDANGGENNTLKPLKFLEASSETETEIFITDIEEFKRNLPSYLPNVISP